MPRIAPGFVALVHTETGAESQPVPESTVHIWETVGWRRKQDDGPNYSDRLAARVDQFVADLDEAAEVASPPADEPHVPEGDDPTPHEED